MRSVGPCCEVFIFNVKIVRRLLPAFLVSVLVLAAVSCASTPKEKTDELDGTEWTWWLNDNSYERYKFRAGKYYYSELKNNGASTDTGEGTYSIDGNKIFLVRANGRKYLFPYVFSEDRQKFWRENESEKFAYKRDTSWTELFTGKK
jgi:hypothetical protein